MTLNKNMSVVLAVSSAVTGLFVLISYAVVLVDVAGIFTLQLPPTSGYLESHYWLGMPKESITGIVVLQVVAGIGFVAWVVWLVGMDDYTLQGSILSTLPWRIALIQTFLWASVFWPFGAYFYMLNRTLGRALVACIPLWIAALATILMIGGTFEARAPVVPTLGMLMFGLIVVLADGVGWAAVCIKTTL